MHTAAQQTVTDQVLLNSTTATRPIGIGENVPTHLEAFQSGIHVVNRQGFNFGVTLVRLRVHGQVRAGHSTLEAAKMTSGV